MRIKSFHFINSFAKYKITEHVCYLHWRFLRSIVMNNVNMLPDKIPPDAGLDSHSQLEESDSGLFNNKTSWLCDFNIFRDDSFQLKNQAISSTSPANSSSLLTPFTAECFTSSERRSALVSFSPYIDETPVNSIESCATSTLMSPFTDKALNTMGRPEISGCVWNPYKEALKRNTKKAAWMRRGPQVH
ncbi:uncharacterized protein LOC111136589 isoform X2 [Crassostrea virginica]